MPVHWVFRRCLLLEYFTYEQGIVRTVTEESDTISGAGNSVIMNRSNGATINGK